MRNKLLAVLTVMAFAYTATGAAAASNLKAMDADIHAVEIQWEHIKFDEDGSPNQFAHIDALAKFTAGLVKKYPGRVEPSIWEGIVTSEEAGMAGTLSAMSYAKSAKAILEAAYQKDPAALDAGAPTSLGVLYYRVPGFPFGFGDNEKARQLLAQAVSLAPNGMDANYFYADFLMSQHEYAAAYKLLADLGTTRPALRIKSSSPSTSRRPNSTGAPATLTSRSLVLSITLPAVSLTPSASPGLRNRARTRAISSSSSKGLRK
jgi:tetratricopeptide (TPR) repeat protein